MNATDMIFNEVYRSSLSEGATERASKDCAVSAMNNFKKSNYKTVGQLIARAISTAKKLSK